MAKLLLYHERRKNTDEGIINLLARRKCVRKLVLLFYFGILLASPFRDDKNKVKKQWLGIAGE